MSMGLNDRLRSSTSSSPTSPWCTTSASTATAASIAESAESASGSTASTASATCGESVVGKQDAIGAWPEGFNRETYHGHHHGHHHVHLGKYRDLHDHRIPLCFHLLVLLV